MPIRTTRPLVRPALVLLLLLLAGCGDDASGTGNDTDPSIGLTSTSSSPGTDPWQQSSEDPDTTTSSGNDPSSTDNPWTSGRTDDPTESTWPDLNPEDDPGLPDYGIDRAPEPGSIVLPPVPRALTPMPGRRNIRVHWWPVEGATGYALYRSSRPGGTPDDAGRIVVEGNEYLDRHAHPGNTWYYAVAALFDDQEGPLSGEVGALSVDPIPPRQLRVSMDPTDLNRLYSRSAYSDVLLPASATILPDNDPLDVVGLRFRGAGSRRYPKFGFNIRLDNRPHFNFGSAYRDGGNRILLNAMWTDPTALRDALGLGIYGELGLPAPTTQFADLFLNDAYEGFYILFERIDREALRGWNLNRRRGGMTLVRDDMKGQRRRLDMEDNRSTFGLDLETMFDTHEERIDFLHDIWDWRGERDDHNWEAVLELAIWAWNTPAGDEFAEGIRERFVYDDLLTLLAVHAIFQDTDALDADYWLYRDEDGDQLWRLLPWDKNLVLGSGWHGDFIGNNDFFRYDYILVNPATNLIITRFMATPSLWADLEERLRELMTHHIHRDWLEQRIANMLPRIVLGLQPGERNDRNWVMQPQQHHGVVGYLPHHLEQIAEYMDLRHAWIHREIDRRNNNRRGEDLRDRAERITLPAGERRCLNDRRGHTYACIQPTRNWIGSVSIAVSDEDDHSIDGVLRRYWLQFSQPFEGHVFLHYHNSPRRNWVAEEHWARDQWRLDMVATGVDQPTRRLRSRVNPFANMVVGEGAFDAGVHTLLLLHGPGVPPPDH
ncbi:MAG: hypothetical protein EA398_07140 [Deltaproteobacteria bacterium]|nr:MAG: hypothetical protein EA398_07140 [Deltaproteobacteria bacterium]